MRFFFVLPGEDQKRCTVWHRIGQFRKLVARNLDARDTACTRALSASWNLTC
jgi:hypothetical protein